MRIHWRQTSDSAISRRCAEAPGPAIRLPLREHARENWPHVVPAAQTRQYREPGSWVWLPGAIATTEDYSEEQPAQQMKKLSERAANTETFFSCVTIMRDGGSFPPALK